MRIAIAILGAALLAGLGGCQGCKEKSKPAAGQPGSGFVEVARPVPNTAARPKASVLDLPKASGTGPVKTAAPLTQAQYEKMSSLEVPGWDKDVRRLDGKALQVRYRSKERPTIGVTLDASPCADCIPMELAKWQAKTDGLKGLLPPELRDHKDTTFEVGSVTLAGAPLIFTYQVGFLFGKDDNDQPHGSYSNTYALYYNDGKNQLRVVASYMDDATASRDQMIDLVPRDHLEKISLAFLDAYTHAW